MSTVQFLMLLPGSLAAIVTLGLHVAAAVRGREGYAARRASRRLKRRLLRPRRRPAVQRVQCSGPVFSLSLSAPERCGFEEGHEGKCEA